MRPATLAELCARHGLEPPADTRGRKFDDFGGFLEVYWAACDGVRTRDDLARLIFEVAEDAAADGAWWIEPAFDAARYSTLRAGGPHRLFATQEEGWLFALEAAQAASRATGVGIGFVSAVDRIMAQDHALERAAVTARLARAGRHLIRSGMRCFAGQHAGIVAFGLHGKEEGHPPEPFAEAFGIALDGTGLLSAPHAGEIAPSPGAGAASVAAALDHLRAQRIAHGVLAIEDAALVARLAAQRICLDVCPTSNLLLRRVPLAAGAPAAPPARSRGALHAGQRRPAAVRRQPVGRVRAVPGSHGPGRCLARGDGPQFLRPQRRAAAGQGRGRGGRGGVALDTLGRAAGTCAVGTPGALSWPWGAPACPTRLETTSTTL